MITRIVLRDFMAHELAVIELGPGLTVLTGPNNTGKSAVVEALRCVAENPAPRHHIRHGAKEARVEVHLEEGSRVVWVRTRTHPRYEIWHPGAEEPEVYAKTGGKVPEDVRALLRMDMVKLEDRKEEIDVHLGNQREPIFLLNQPGSVMAQFFAASTEGAHLLSMQDALKAKAVAARRTRDENGRRQKAMEQGLDALAPLPWLELTRQKAEAILEEIRSVQAAAPLVATRIQALRGVRSRLAALGKASAVYSRLTAAGELLRVRPLAWITESLAHVRRKASRATARTRVLAPLQAASEMFPAARLATVVDRLSSGRRQEAVYQRRQVGLRPLAVAPVLADTAALARLIERRKGVDQDLHAASRARGGLARLEEAPRLFSTAPLEAMGGRLRALQKQTQRFRQEESLLNRAVAPPDLADLAPMARSIRQLMELRERRETLCGEMEKRGQELEQWKAGLEKRLQELGVCPLCGAALDVRRFLEEGHVHG